MKSRTLIPVLFVSAFIIFVCLFELYRGMSVFENVTLMQVRQIYNVLIDARLWNASRGGVYAFVTEQNMPNPYLQVPERDLETVHGEKLTMINPAYMTRQIAEIINSGRDLKIHLTSIDPLRPENMPSDWEYTALESFEKGEKEYYEWFELSGISFLRYMAPLYMEVPCIYCHSDSSIGEVRGGLSIIQNVDDLRKQYLYKNISTVLILLVFGLIVVLVLRSILLKLTITESALAEKVEKLKVEMSRREDSEAAMLQHAKMNTKGEILRSIAHHWRQPINTVCATLQYLQDAYRLSREDVALAENAIGSAVELSRTIDNFTKVFSPVKDDLVFDFCEGITDIAVIFEPYLKEKNIRMRISRLEDEATEVNSLPQFQCFNFTNCKYECSDGIKMTINGDLSEFRQVMTYFMMNCVEAIDGKREKEGSDFRAFVELEFYKSGQFYCIKISDNGEGIAPENIASIYDPYFTTRGCDAGRGVGLFLAKTMVENTFGGTIELLKHTGGASFLVKFHVLLPHN